jgi:formaldehyde-activating enzyme involved in methanogenesis
MDTLIKLITRAIQSPGSASSRDMRDIEGAFQEAVEKAVMESLRDGTLGNSDAFRKAVLKAVDPNKLKY